MRIGAIDDWTPIITYRCGSIPDVMGDGVTGFMIHGLEATLRAAEHIPTLSQNHRRRLFEPRFHVSRLTEDYQTLSQPPIHSPLTLIYAE